MFNLRGCWWNAIRDDSHMPLRGVQVVVFHSGNSPLFHRSTAFYTSQRSRDYSFSAVPSLREIESIAERSHRGSRWIQERTGIWLACSLPGRRRSSCSLPRWRSILAHTGPKDEVHGYFWACLCTIQFEYKNWFGIVMPVRYSLTRSSYPSVQGSAIPLVEQYPELKYWNASCSTHSGGSLQRCLNSVALKYRK